MQLLNAIPVNWFIVIVSVLTAVILYLILFKVPDEEPETETENKSESKGVRELESKKTKAKKKSSTR